MTDPDFVAPPEHFAQPDDTGVALASEASTSIWGRLGAQAMNTLDPQDSLSGGFIARRVREGIAGGYLPHDYDGVGTPAQQLRLQEIEEHARAQIPDVSRDDAKAMLKQEGLSEQDVTLGDAASMKLPVLQLKINEAHERRDRAAAILRGPQGFVPGALGAVTSIGAGMVDPVNALAFSIPVIGEARYGKMLASAGDSILARGAVRAGVGAAQGAVGTAALQPADWWLHTMDGHDYTFADALESVVLGAGMGAGFHGLGAVGDVYARMRGLPLPGTIVPHPADALADLPDPAKRDALQVAMADLVADRPVRAAEMLDIAADHDPQIADSLAPPSAARDAVFADVQRQLVAAGVPEDEASANAAIVAARYATRAERLGGEAGNAFDLYQAEGLEVRRADIGAEGEGRMLLQSRPTAPTFYSAVGRTIEDAKQDKASPEQWLGMLKNASGVKPEEMQWLGLEDWLKAQKGPVTKDQVRDFVRANQIEVREVLKGQEEPELEPEFENDAERMAYRLRAAARNATRYDEYTLPGAENYRELLLTLPPKAEAVPKMSYEEFATATRAAHPEMTISDQDMRESYDAIGHLPMATGRSQENFVTRHWSEENVVAHVRLSDRAVGGKKALHIEELQSDWHQEGRRKGYQTDAALARLKQIEDDFAELRSPVRRMLRANDQLGFDTVSEAESALRNGPVDAWEFNSPQDQALAQRYQLASQRVSLAKRMVSEAVPEAPFKTTWPELALKRIVRYAAEHGYDEVSWTPGESQPTNPKKLGATDAAAERANKGLIEFYDKILPATVNKVFKKFGAKVDTAEMSVLDQADRDLPFTVRDRNGAVVETGIHSETHAMERAREIGGTYGLDETAGETRPIPVHKLDITPELRRTAIERGFSLFQSRPKIPDRRFGIPAEADPPVRSYVNTSEMRAHPDYEAAKAGDRPAAARMVVDLVKPETVEQARERFGRDALYVPVHAEEESGRNAIPQALAHFYAESTGAEVDDNIVQGSRAYHTGASAVERLIARPSFDGLVQPGRRYVIVDDVSVMGNTLAEIAHHIRAGGGDVAGVVTLVNQSRMAHNVPKPARTRLLEDRLGQAIRDELGIEPGSLTAAETEYLLGFRDADSFRNRVAKARQERGERLLSKGVRPSASEGDVGPGNGGSLNQAGGEGARGRITLSDNRAIVDLFRSADQSTFMHEAGHLWLDELMRDAARPDAPEQLRADHDIVLAWLGVKDASEIGVAEHEQWARGFEGYLATGEAPSGALARAFEQFKTWMRAIYRAVLGAGREVSPEVRGVMDRLLATDTEIATRKPTSLASAIADPRWRSLADAPPAYDEPQALEESAAAAHEPEPASLVPERSLTELERAAADAEAIWRQLAPTLPEEQRAAVEAAFAAMDNERGVRAQMITEGVTCLLQAAA